MAAKVGKHSLRGEDVSGRSLTSGNRQAPRESGQAEVSAHSLAKKRAHAHDAAAWRLEPHVCRHCFGRLASTGAPGGARRYQCTNCGAEAVGLTPDVLCSCGLKLRSHGPGGGLVDAGLRCQPNPSPSPEFPSLFVAAEART